MLRRIEEQKSNHLNINYIYKLLLVPKRERTKNQLATLVKYFKNLKVFKDLLIRKSDSNVTKEMQHAATNEENLSFEHLVGSVRVLEVKQSEQVLMEEGEEGDLFYIILSGECQVLKATPYVIHTMTHNEAIQDKLPFYFRAFMENYDDIYWRGMDITRQNVDEMLGILRDDDGDGSGKIISIPKWPISKERQ